MRNYLFLLFLLIATNFYAQEDLIRKWTRELCAPEMHGRGYVHNGDNIAADYLVNEYLTMGLTPVPGQKSMRQPFQFPVNTFPGRMLFTLNGVEVKPGEGYIVSPASGAYEGQLLPFLLNKENYSTLASPGELKRGIEGNSYNVILVDKKGITGDSLKIMDEVLTKWNEILPIVELFDKKFTWSVSTTARKYPYVYLRDSLYTSQDMYMHIESEFVHRHTSNNIVAYIPAKKQTNKTIYFTAHYDHLGRMGVETYFPGANDNASGTAMLLSLAKHFKSYPAKYNIVFVSFAGEEAGLIGSRYYTENPLTKLSDIKFLVNLDIMGSGEEGITIVNATLFPKAFKKFKRINKKGKLLTNVNPRGPAANSDHYFFTEKGVPAVFIYTMGPNKHYHDIFDTYEELSFAEYNDLIQLLKQFVKKI